MLLEQGDLITQEELDKIIDEMKIDDGIYFFK
jgi:hypothetical protein